MVWFGWKEPFTVFTVGALFFCDLKKKDSQKVEHERLVGPRGKYTSGWF